MALDIAEKLRNPVGTLTEVYVDVTGPASYLADGQTLLASDLGLRKILHASAGASDDGAQFCAVSHATHSSVDSVKIQWFVVGTGAEVADAVDLSDRFVRVRVIGR
jgi:hypothetical protein